MPDEAPVMTATRPVAESVLMVVLLAKSGWADTHCAPDRGRLRGPTRGGPAGPLTRSVRGLRWLLPPVGMPLPRLPGNDEHDRERRQRHRRVPRQPTREDPPEQAGLPSYGQRRVPGLRREEVASRAGVSADYYRRLERGQVSGVSELVLEALGRALQLDDAERSHLFDLARAVNPVAPRRARPPKTRIPPVVQRLLDQIEAPTVVTSVHQDMLAANGLGRALYAPVFESPEQPANIARFTFLDATARDFYPAWERLASDLVATLRSHAGRNPYDPRSKTSSASSRRAATSSGSA